MAYTPPTVLQLKTSVATQLGKTDYATPNVVRDSSINDSRREIYASNKWGFLKKRVTITWVQDANTNGTYSWPTTYTPEYDLGRMYDPAPGSSATAPVQNKYVQVELEDIPRYAINSTSDYVFAVDYENQKFVSNQNNTATVQFVYFAFPRDWALDGTDDAQSEIAPPLVYTAIRLLAIAQYWLAAERDEENYDRFFRRATAALSLAQSLDAREGPATSIKHALTGQALGFNSNSLSDGF